MIVVRTLLPAALVAALSFTPAALAGGKKLSPVAEHLEALSVGNAREFRLAVVHPIYGPKLTAVEHGLSSAASLDPDSLGVTVRRGKVELRSFLETRALILPGEIVRGPRADLAAEEYVTTEGDARSAFGVRAISEEQPSDAASVEPRVLGDLLPPTLRWHALSSQDKELRQAVRSWTGAVRLDTQRKSVLDLPAHETLKTRFAEYEKALAVTAKPPAGTDLVGYALVVDGSLAQIETFSSPVLLQTWWPRIVRSLALECTVLEAQHELLDQVMAAGVDPDRHLAQVKERLLSLYAPKPRTSRLPAVGEAWLIEAPRDTTAHALVLDDKAAHLLVTVRPDRRADTQPDEKLDPGAITRKQRPTEAEKRWLERRGARNPPIPKPGD